MEGGGRKLMDGGGGGKQVDHGGGDVLQALMRWRRDTNIHRTQNSTGTRS